MSAGWTTQARRSERDFPVALHIPRGLIPLISHETTFTSTEEAQNGRTPSQGMTCGGIARRSASKSRKFPAVESVEADRAAGRLTVRGTNVDESAVRRAVAGSRIRGCGVGRECPLGETKTSVALATLQADEHALRLEYVSPSGTRCGGCSRRNAPDAERRSARTPGNRSSTRPRRTQRPSSFSGRPPSADRIDRRSLVRSAHALDKGFE